MHMHSVLATPENIDWLEKHRQEYCDCSVSSEKKTTELFVFPIVPTVRETRIRVRRPDTHRDEGEGGRVQHIPDAQTC